LEIAMLRFKNADLRPVIAEAVANNCALLFVKDQGVYFMSENGERMPDGRQKLIAYAIDCNPLTSTISMPGGAWRTSNSVAMISERVSMSRKACSSAF
jgi:hypothetical protein